MPFTTTVITGATSGIGKETALTLAQKDHAVYLLVRDVVKGEQVKQEIISASKNKNIYVINCDLADLQSVRNAADTLRASLMAINVLINNAGGIFNSYQETKDGHEMTFQVNHLGHFLLVQSLLPLLERGQARIINISSDAHRIGKPRMQDINWKKREYSSVGAYAMAKLFNIYFTRSLEVKYGTKGVSAFAVHPGTVNTGFGNQLTGFYKNLLSLIRPFMQTVEQGAKTPVYLATANRVDAHSGKYFKNKHITGPASIATDEPARNKLWELSMEMVEPYL